MIVELSADIVINGAIVGSRAVLAKSSLLFYNDPTLRYMYQNEVGLTGRFPFIITNIYNFVLAKIHLDYVL